MYLSGVFVPASDIEGNNLVISRGNNHEERAINDLLSEIDSLIWLHLQSHPTISRHLLNCE